MFKFARHECPHCHATNQLPPSMLTLGEPKAGDALMINCPHCTKLYYLSWLGPWDGDDTTVEGKKRWEEERRFSERFAK